MAILDIFSKRMKKERGETPDVYQYSIFEQSLRVKVVHIIRDVMRITNPGYNGEEYYGNIIKLLCKEYGVFALQNHYRSNQEHLMNYFLEEQDTEKALDVVELCCRVIEHHKREVCQYTPEWKKFIDNSLQELNDRFQEEGFGYKYESGMIMKITTEFTHNEIVKPALNLLNDKRFDGANSEFLSAHQHYRKNEIKECLVDCLKAFESTMKIICGIEKYKVDSRATASQLIAILLKNNYIPNYLESQCNALRSILESGVPTLRNNLAGHGQGETVVAVDNNYASYALNMTASNIVFLVSLLNGKEKMT